MSTAYPARAVVNLDAIAANTRTLREHARSSELMAIVKADAYGHGLVPAARAALAGGATSCGVAQLSEALALRAAGVTCPIFTWMYTPGADLESALRADLEVSVGAPWALAEVRAAARASGITARVHLKVDTGLARGGQLLEPWTEMLREAMRAQADGALEVVGVWSHLAVGEEPRSPITQSQREVFDEAIRRAESAGARPRVRHLAASAALLGHAGLAYDLVRPGLALYGLSPLPGVAPADLGLTPAMRLETEVMLVKDVPAGQGVSYGHTYTAPRATRLADLPIGYGDGLPRSASNVGEVLLGGRRRRVAGRICMDQTVVDLDGDPSVSAGQRAVVFGPGASGEPTAQDWAVAAGTISYEIVTRLGARVPRVYEGSAGLVDAGTPPGDAGTPPGDVSTPPRDAGTPPGDAGTPPRDVSTPPGDASTPPGEEGGRAR